MLGSSGLFRVTSQEVARWLEKEVLEEQGGSTKLRSGSLEDSGHPCLALFRVIPPPAAPSLSLSAASRTGTLFLPSSRLSHGGGCLLNSREVSAQDIAAAARSGAILGWTDWCEELCARRARRGGGKRTFQNLGVPLCLGTLPVSGAHAPPSPARKKQRWNDVCVYWGEGGALESCEGGRHVPGEGGELGQSPPGWRQPFSWELLPSRRLPLRPPKAGACGLFAPFLFFPGPSEPVGAALFGLSLVQAKVRKRACEERDQQCLFCINFREPGEETRTCALLYRSPDWRGKVGSALSWLQQAKAAGSVFSPTFFLLSEILLSFASWSCNPRALLGLSHESKLAEEGSRATVHPFLSLPPIFLLFGLVLHLYWIKELDPKPHPSRFSRGLPPPPMVLRLQPRLLPCGRFSPTSFAAEFSTHDLFHGEGNFGYI